MSGFLIWISFFAEVDSEGVESLGFMKYRHEVIGKLGEFDGGVLTRKYKTLLRDIRTVLEGTANIAESTEFTEFNPFLK